MAVTGCTRKTWLCAFVVVAQITWTLVAILLIAIASIPLDQSYPNHKGVITVVMLAAIAYVACTGTRRFLCCGKTIEREKRG
jgi:hypothetical protein